MKGVGKVSSPIKNQICFWAVIPVIGIRADYSFLTIHNKSLITIATEVALEVPQIEHTIIATDKLYDFHGISMDSQIDVLKIKKSDYISDLSFPYLMYILSQVNEKFSQISKGYSDCDGLIILDPLCPLRKPVHIQDAIVLFMSQINQPRPWLSVVSVGLAPNHFHPKKILKMNRDGSLDYFDPKGHQIYQRQQLAGDSYYYENGAIFIVDSKGINASVLDKKEMIGFFIKEPMVTVKGKHELDLAGALLDHEGAFEQ